VTTAREYRDRIDAVNAAGPFEPSWDSLAGFDVPDWYVNGKFGIFIHWGAYAVPAFGNEWYPRNMYLQDSPAYRHHLDTYGPASRFGYKDLIDRFTARSFDATGWASLFRRAGAQFVVPVAEHHDGFAMYDSEFSRWTAARRGPCRDVVGELARAVRAQSMVFGVSSHRAEHWWFFHGGMRFDSDVADPRYADLYGPAMPEQMPPNEEFLENWLVRCAELVDRYEPALVWFDWWIEQPVFAPYLQQFAAYYYNRAVQWRRQVAINYKYESFAPGTAVFDVERGQLAGIREQFWQTDTSVGKTSWSHVDGEEYKRLPDLLGDLVDIVSKNGALLLNIGPRFDGTIPDEQQELLRGIGDWLAVNGEAIYGTRPAAVFGEGPTEVVAGSFHDTERPPFTSRDVRYTTRGDTLYAVVLAWPADGVVRLREVGEGGALSRTASTVRLLGHDADLAVRMDGSELVVQLPDARPSEHMLALRIT